MNGDNDGIAKYAFFYKSHETISIGYEPREKEKIQNNIIILAVLYYDNMMFYLHFIDFWPDETQCIVDLKQLKFTKITLS